MGAQWKQAGREANAQKKGQMVVKLVREIMVAAKMGGADPELNARLYVAVEKARKSSVTRDTIERAIKKGAGLTDEKIVFELVTYEGFAPHKIPVIVECLSDNRNRTAPEIRNIFKAGSLGQPGSVSFFFNHLGVVEATHPDAGRDADGKSQRKNFCPEPRHLVIDVLAGFEPRAFDEHEHDAEADAQRRVDVMKGNRCAKLNS